jgi:hypothetical protein
VKINPTSQSLILPGESPEADRRFERALRLNGARETAKFTVVVPPTSAETVRAGEAAVQALQPDVGMDAGKIDIPRVSRTAVRRESPRWKEFYRMVTERDNNLPKGGKLDVVA